MDKRVHPKIEELIIGNKVFHKYPIHRSNTNTREDLPFLQKKPEAIQIWPVLKKLVGKELTKITMPVEFNEPISMLQKTIMFLEYKEGIEKANQTKDIYLQCAYILSTFFISYVNSIHTRRKPFNPLLGETYELVDEDNKSKLIVEQVSHHPPISAFYFENEHFTMDGHFYSQLSLSMKGLIFNPLGQNTITLKSTGEKFQITRPVSSVHNILFGNFYIWNSGKMTCKHLKTGIIASMILETSGLVYTNKSYMASGEVKNLMGKVKYSLEGKWDSFMKATEIESKEEIMLIKAYEFPKRAPLQFYFSNWMINANYLRKKMIYFLPPTDTRFRTDQRAWENGNIDFATSEKDRLERNQRSRRKERKKKNEIWKPKYFDFEIQNKKVIICQYKKKYFEFRDKGEWPEQDTNIFL